MAEDWVKIAKDWDKLEARARKLSLAQAQKLMALLKARDKALEKHEKEFRAAIKAAVASGVTATDYKAYQGKPGVAAARKALDEDCRQLVNEINEVQIYCKECNEVVRGLEKLSVIIAKGDGSKMASPELKKCRNYVAAIQTRMRDLHTASDLHFSIDKFLLAFQKQYNDWISHLIKEEQKDGKKEAEKTAAKEASVAGIDEKSLKAAEETAEKLHEKMQPPLVEAHQLLEGQISADVLKKASGLVKTSQGEFIKLNKFAGQVKDLYAKNKKKIDAAKNAKVLQGHISEVAEIAKRAASEFAMVGDELKAAMKKK